MSPRIILSCALITLLPAVAAAQQAHPAPQAAAEPAVEGQDAAAAQSAACAAVEGQDPVLAGTGFEAAITTQLTTQSHTIAANSSQDFLEGASCPAPTRMVSGACHPGFTDRMVIINQFPNVFANTWRCGFRNNDSSNRTVWIYTLCAQ